MKIVKDELFGEEQLNLNFELDLSKTEVNDTLVKSILSCNVDLKTYIIENDEVEVSLNVKSEILYLDARTLEELTINVDFSESIPFTSNLEKSKELDIDLILEELDLKQLIEELLIIYIPFNYSESKPINVKTQEEFENSNKPFADLLKK